MKIFILIFLICIISPNASRRHNEDEDIYELDDLLNNKYDRSQYHSNNRLVGDETDDNQYYPTEDQHKKVNPSRKKVLKNNDYNNDEPEPEPESDADDLLPKRTSTNRNELSEKSKCVNQYEVQSEQLVKVKELKDGAHLLRYVLIDKRVLPSNLKVKDGCMLECCAEKQCDLAMLSEQPTHDGYKCYLFSCNGSCPLATHQDYTVMIPKADVARYMQLTTINSDESSTSTIANTNVPYKRSIFQETSVVIFLILGLICTIILFVLIFCHCRDSRKRGRRLKNHSVDADYLINGLYL